MVLLFDLKQSVAITSFAILSSQVVLNYSAIRLRKKIPDLKTFKTPLYPLVAALGLASSVVLMFSLPQQSWIVDGAVLVAASGYYLARGRLR